MSQRRRGRSPSPSDDELPDPAFNLMPAKEKRVALKRRKVGAKPTAAAGEPADDEDVVFTGRQDNPRQAHQEPPQPDAQEGQEDAAPPQTPNAASTSDAAETGSASVRRSGRSRHDSGRKQDSDSSAALKDELRANGRDPFGARAKAARRLPTVGEAGVEEDGAEEDDGPGGGPAETAAEPPLQQDGGDEGEETEEEEAEAGDPHLPTAQETGRPLRPAAEMADERQGLLTLFSCVSTYTVFNFHTLYRSHNYCKIYARFLHFRVQRDPHGTDLEGCIACVDIWDERRPKARDVHRQGRFGRGHVPTPGPQQ